jgi:hypothetical protein
MALHTQGGTEQHRRPFGDDGVVGIENFEIRNLSPERPWFETVERQRGATVKYDK